MKIRIRLLGLIVGTLSTALALVIGGISQNETTTTQNGTSATEAPTGFDNQTNGLVDQATHDADRATFEEVDTPATGLGPVFNSQSCANCHASPKSGGTSAITELRAGHLDSTGAFVNPTVVINGGATTISGRSLINQFAVCPAAQETVPSTETIRAIRMTPGALGDGYVEAIDDQTLINISQSQRIRTGGRIQGEYIQVPVLEAGGATRIGRFGWKDQHGSLLSFAGDAYLNEQGITNRLFPVDVTPICDGDLNDPEDSGAEGSADIDKFAEFFRAAKAPSVNTFAMSQPDAQTGSRLFDAIGCSTCHVRSLTTAPAGTVINGGMFTVPDVLGSKVIHPYSDFLLHNIGTGDGIQQNGPPSTRNKLRTAPLWGLRFRTSLMHDGKSGTPAGAILRHRGEAFGALNAYQGLTLRQKAQLGRFLGAL